MLASTGAQEAPGLIGLLPGREPLRPVNARELAGLRVPRDKARDEEAGAEVEVESAPGHARFTLMRSWAPQVRIWTPASGSPARGPQSRRQQPRRRLQAMGSPQSTPGVPGGRSSGSSR